VPDRRPGSVGNQQATNYVEQILTGLGWTTSSREFDCLDWRTDGGTLVVDTTSIDIDPSPYGLPVDTSGPVKIARTLDDLSDPDINGAVLIIDGDLAAEPLTPRGYPFYENERHTGILDALERARPAAIVALTGTCPGLCGAVDPFPLIEDGGFPIPVAAARLKQAGSILEGEGRTAHVSVESERLAASARNISGHRGPSDRRFLVIAHVDSKPGTPGAVDNASGVAVLLLLAELLLNQPADGPIGVELLAVNGEDNYAAPGEVVWLEEHGDEIENIPLVINIDGACYRNGTTSFSSYNLTPESEAFVNSRFEPTPLGPGPVWYQSDHAIFAMRGRPALAITSEPLGDLMASLFHTAADTPDQVDPGQIVQTALALADLVGAWPTSND
jgi:aminopeptidase YwaD